ncbi:MAG: hypothetical protein F6K42_07450 [Leptolyngbya sp. SIO1D8]|nr:hypothetical protein [Leptolyngbya sp. SIO1D8]
MIEVLASFLVIELISSTAIVSTRNNPRLQYELPGELFDIGYVAESERIELATLTSQRHFIIYLRKADALTDKLVNELKFDFSPQYGLAFSAVLEIPEPGSLFF